MQKGWLQTTLVTVVAACGAVALPGVASAQVPCTGVEIIGLRGSGEELNADEHNMGKLVGPMADAIADKIPAPVSRRFVGIAYPAGDASAVTVLSRSYFASKELGESVLDSYLDTRMGTCPDTKYVVMGYSQGAHAAGDLLAREPSSTTDKIKAFIMFGDPRFNPDAEYTWGSFDPRNHGIAGARSLNDFSSWKKRVMSFCNNGDLICQGIGFGHGTDTHSAANYINPYQTLITGRVRQLLGFSVPTPPARPPLDLAFVIDSTGSMSGSIDGVTRAAATMVDNLDASSDWRVGLVDYKDTDQGDPYAARVDLAMTSNGTSFRTAVQSLVASGGGDYPEGVYSGLITAFQQLTWRPGSRRSVILIGDAPAKDPEPITGYRLSDVIAASPPAARVAAAAAADGAAIYPLSIFGGGGGTFAALAAETGGRVFGVEDPELVTDQVLAAVDEASGAEATLQLTLAAPPVNRAGRPVSFVANASYEVADVTEYEWDFDADGTVDEETTTGRTEHLYDGEYFGNVRVTARAANGVARSAAAFIEVYEDAPVAAGPPLGLRAEGPQTGGNLQLAWDEPEDLGGSELVSYQVLVSHDASGVDTLLLPPEARRTGFAGLDTGRYTVTVAAITDAGTGAPASIDIDVKNYVPSGGSFVPPVFVPQGSFPSGLPGQSVLPGPPVSAKVTRVHWRARKLLFRVACPAAAPSRCLVRATLMTKGRRPRQLGKTRAILLQGAVRPMSIRLNRRKLRVARRAAVRLLVQTVTDGGQLTQFRAVPPRRRQ
jgi:hypothetical protein